MGARPATPVAAAGESSDSSVPATMEVLVAPPGLPAGAPPTVTAYDFYRPPDPHAPMLRINMVTSVDGRVTDVDGRSGGLGGEGDLRAFRAQRALADCILVGAGTARVEGYGPHRIHRSVAGRRRDDGRTRAAPIVVVTGSCDLDPDDRLFIEPDAHTIILTHAGAPADRRAALARVAEVLVTGRDRVDLAAGLGLLRDRGLAHVLCEGGPRLNAQLISAGLVDELCVTLAPQLVGGQGPHLVADGQSRPVELRLTGLGREGAELYARYAVPGGTR